MTTAADRLTRVATRAAIGHAETLARAPWYAPAMASLLEAESVAARQRRLRCEVLHHVAARTTPSIRRGERELDGRRELDADRAAMPHPPVVWWHESGPDGAPPLLLLNGWTASGLMWPASFVEPLSATHRVLRIDNRGTGWSRTAPAPYTIRTMADDAAAVLRVAAGGRPATVVGLSMGGMIAQEMAIRHPELVGALVLAGTRPPAPAHLPAAPAVMRRVFAGRAPGESVEHLVGEMWSSFCAPGFAAAHPDLLDELVGQVLQRVTPTAAVNTQMRAIAAWHGPARLRRIGCPTVVVHGDQDRLMPVGNGMRLSRLIGGARYVELADVGHIVPMEAAAALAGIVAELAAGVR